MNITKLTIDKKTWARGSRYNSQGLAIDNKLLGNDGKKCCLGFLGEACGVTELAEVNTPSQKLSLDHWQDGLVVDDFMSGRIINTIWTNEAMKLNDLDSRKITFKERVKRLKTHFKKIGISLTVK